MTNHTDLQLQSIDRATLTPLVRQALGRETVDVSDYRFQEIHGGVSGGGVPLHRERARPG